MTTDQLQELSSVAEKAHPLAITGCHCTWCTNFRTEFRAATCAELVRRLMGVEKELTEMRACDKCDLCEGHYE